MQDSRQAVMLEMPSTCKGAVEVPKRAGREMENATNRQPELDLTG